MIIIGQKTENSKAPRQADIEFRRKEYWFREHKDECVDRPRLCRKSHLRR